MLIYFNKLDIFIDFDKVGAFEYLITYVDAYLVAETAVF